MTAVAADPCGVTLETACREWLDERFGDSPGTYSRYELTMRRVAAYLGAGDHDVATVSGQDYFRALKGLWGKRKPATWNANRAAVSSFLKWLRDLAEYADVKLPARCTSKKVDQDDTKAVDREDLDVLWDPETAPLRERSLWRCKYESSSRAEALLKLNVPDIDWKRRRARVRVKGGAIKWLHFGEMGIELLREYVGDRTEGPVWLTETRPWNWRDRDRADRGPGDRCRLSYNRAEEIFKATTTALGFSGDETSFEFLTLHQLRHSRLTHLAEDGTDTPMLQAISNHRDPRTLHRRYTKPSSRAVALHLAAVDKKDAERRRGRRRPPRGSVSTRTSRYGRVGGTRTGNSQERRRR